MNFDLARRFFSIFYILVSFVIVFVFISSITLFIAATYLFLSLNESFTKVPHIIYLIGIFGYFIISFIIVYASYHLVHNKDKYYELLVEEYFYDDVDSFTFTV